MYGPLPTLTRTIADASDVCKYLVLHDIPGSNPFRDLIPLTHHQPLLLQIIIANSATHMSNAWQRAPQSTTASSPVDRLSNPRVSSCLMAPAVQDLAAYHDALMAKQRALCLLRSTLASMASANIEVTLAAVLLFIELELIDCGRDSWRHHIHGARMIIKSLFDADLLRRDAMSPLRRWLISNCLVYVCQLATRHVLVIR